MTEFGNRLRYHRRNCTDPERGGALTQERLGEFIGHHLGDLGFTGAAISSWENGRSSPSQNDRLVLISLVKALHQCGGLPTLAEANLLLAAGNYLTMLPTEIREVDDSWLVEKSGYPVATEPQPVLEIPNPQWARLKPFLPDTLYQQVELAPRERRAELCLAHLKPLLRTVATYLPHHVARALLHHPRPPTGQIRGEFLTGTLLFADISGFTNLSERLRQMGGKEGAEEVVRIINKYLDVMLGILFRHGGQLIKFGGDAMLCLFTGEHQGAMQAIWAAWQMSETMTTEFAHVTALQEIFPLSMKVGHSSGLLFAATVGTEVHLEYIITGSAVERTARAESAAQKEQVIISVETYEEVKDLVQAVVLPENPEYYRVTAVPLQPEAHLPVPWTEVETWLNTPDLDVWELVTRLESLTPYLPVGLLPQLVYDPTLKFLSGQHRQVTVLFANFAGMSDVIEGYGPAGTAAITNVLSEYFNLMQEEAHYYGGATNKVDLYDQGDKLMVVFGAPVAHERDARRAALTALAMQQAIDRVTDPLAAVFLSQRIGIHTGFVFAGHVGSALHNRREYTVMGETVNLAARLMSKAPSGDIWVSHDLWQQIASEFEASSLPPVQLKGISEPVAIYRLQAAHALAGDARPLRALQSPLVGREREVGELLQVVNSLLFGEGKKVVALMGEGGVGKSRLVAEWQLQAAEVVDTQSIQWISGYGRSYGQRTYGIFIEVLERLVGMKDTDTPADKWNKLGQMLRASLAGKTPDWSNRFINQLAYLGCFLGFELGLRQGLAERVAGLEAETLQLQTWLALADLFTFAAQVEPLILILEDLHWADDASLDLLQFLVDKIDDRTPILFCLIFRAQKDRRIWQIWQTLQHDYPFCLAFPIRELVKIEADRLLMNLLQADQVPAPNLMELILEETDGNPLYMEEVLHRLIAEEILIEREGVWELARPVTRAAVPNSLYQVIQSRIDDLDFGSPGARRVLWLASVLGTSFPEDALRHLFESLGRDAAEFQRHMRELGNAYLLERRRVKAGDGERPGFQFRHGLVQQVAYENMPVTHRRQYHHEVAQWLEATYPENLQPYYEGLADHYDQADQPAKAFSYHLLAGQQDARAFANTRARMHLERALHLAQIVPPLYAELGKVHFELGRVLTVVGESTIAMDHLMQAFENFVAAGEMAAAARACYEIGRHDELQTDLEMAWEWRDRGLALLPETPTPEAALLYALGSLVRVRQGRLAEADQEAAQTLTIAQATNSPMELSFAHRLLSISLRSQGKLSEALEHCRQSLTLCEETGDLIGLIKNTINLGILHFERDDWPAAGEAYQQAIALLERAGDQYQLGLVHTNLADLYYHLGYLAQSELHAHKVLAIAEKIGATQQILTVRVILAIGAWRRKELAQALAHLSKASHLAETAEMFQPTVDRWLAQVYLTQGDLPRARTLLEKWLGEDAEVLADEAEPIQMLYAQTLASQGDINQAVQRLEASLHRLQEVGMQYQTGQAMLALAKVLGTSNSTAAQKYAEHAHEIFSSLSAHLDEEEAKDLLTNHI